MSGLVKAKKYDWKDSNMAMFGSDTEKEVKKESAMSEPAWEGAGEEVGLQIWRIVKFEVTHWPKDQYGKFYSGDSYIILNTYKPDPENEALAWDVHFWIGKYSTQDEYGTAAYKTVELDTYLDDAPVQHREVMNHESELFQSYFPQGITIMEGGAESGFNHVTPEEYQPRLLHFSGKRKAITVKEVPLCKDRLKSDDVFILDLGLQLYQWNGSGCNKDERFKAMQFLQELKGERGNAESEVLDEGDCGDGHPFMEALTGEDEEEDDEVDDSGLRDLYRVSVDEVNDDSGVCAIAKVKEGEVALEDFVSDDVFILDAGSECFVWIGSGASSKEKKNGLSYAHKHLMGTGHALIPITVVKEGQRNEAFNTAIAA